MVKDQDYDDTMHTLELAREELSLKDSEVGI
jgi:hypothetical protein